MYCYVCIEVNVDFFIDDIDNFYIIVLGKFFNWIQGNKVGGCLLFWVCQLYCMSDYDFKVVSCDGYGIDWFISYVELVFYYDRVEEYVGVLGKFEGFDVLFDGKFFLLMFYLCGEQIFVDILKDKFDVLMIIGCIVVLIEL